MRNLGLMIAPLGVLLSLASAASVLGVGLLQLTGDILPLSKVVSKLTLILLLISIFPLRKWLRFSWRDLGFAESALFFRQIGQGLLLGLLTLMPVLATLYWLDVHVWDQERVWTVPKILAKTAVALFLALLIAVGEELLFRGLLLSTFRRKLSTALAIGLSAIYYAALHFLKSTTQIPLAEQTFGSGFRLMAEAFANWLNPDIFSAFLALCVVGAFLAILRSRLPQSLGLCIGCHAGWVWQIKVSKDFFNVNPQADYLYLVSHYDGVVGPMVSVWLTLALLIGLKISRKAGFKG